jgi:hypothetical protein
MGPSLYMQYVLKEISLCIPMYFKKQFIVGHWWLTPVILASQEEEIRRLKV